jgi:hypothetical protein
MSEQATDHKSIDVEIQNHPAKETVEVELTSPSKDEPNTEKKMMQDD